MNLCRIIGHHPGQTITGFRNIDAAVIMRCRFCGLPIVSPRYKAAGHIMLNLYGEAAVEVAVEHARAHIVNSISLAIRQSCYAPASYIGCW